MQLESNIPTGSIHRPRLVRGVGTLAVAVRHLANHVREILRSLWEANEFLLATVPQRLGLRKLSGEASELEIYR